MSRAPPTSRAVIFTKLQAHRPFMLGRIPLPRGYFTTQHRFMDNSELSVACPRMIQTQEGQSLQLHVHASGKPSPAITVHELPRGLRASQGRASVVISGTPPKGLHDVRVAVQNGGIPLSRYISINAVARQSSLPESPLRPSGNIWTAPAASICAPITITAPSRPAVEGHRFGGSISAIGSLGTNLTLNGGLPPGLLAHNVMSSISISGTPALATLGKPQSDRSVTRRDRPPAAQGQLQNVPIRRYGQIVTC